MAQKMGVDTSKKRFSDLLLQWNKKENKRQMPWKGEKDPYKIWLSEIILQQTRVEQGLNYYHNLLNAFPDINKLAKAPDRKVYKLWEGLGYYTRCKNLLQTARHISFERKGIFPNTYDEIKELKGVGPYTAAAISSFAFNLPYAVVDGNVFRVLARNFGIKKPVDSTEGKKFFSALAQELLDKKYPGLYNQAIMDFGATVCKPVSPDCAKCLFNKTCYAFLHNKIDSLPVKEKRVKIRERWFYYFLFEYKGKLAISQRKKKDIWQELFEFPVIESSTHIPAKILIQQFQKKYSLKKTTGNIAHVSVVYKQQLSHQLIKGQFIHIKPDQQPTFKGDWLWINKSRLKNYPFPRFINQHINKV